MLNRIFLFLSIVLLALALLLFVNSFYVIYDISDIINKKTSSILTAILFILGFLFWAASIDFDKKAGEDYAACINFIPAYFV